MLTFFLLIFVSLKRWFTWWLLLSFRDNILPFLCALGHWPLVSPERLLCYLNRKRHTWVGFEGRKLKLKISKWDHLFNILLHKLFVFLNNTIKNLHFLWCGLKLWLEHNWNHQAGNGFPQLLVSGDINSWHSSSSYGHTLQKFSWVRERGGENQQEFQQEKDNTF